MMYLQLCPIDTIVRIYSRPNINICFIPGSHKTVKTHGSALVRASPEVVKCVKTYLQLHRSLNGSVDHEEWLKSAFFCRKDGGSMTQVGHIIGSTSKKVSETVLDFRQTCNWILKKLSSLFFSLLFYVLLSSSIIHFFIR